MLCCLAACCLFALKKLSEKGGAPADGAKSDGPTTAGDGDAGGGGAARGNGERGPHEDTSGMIEQLLQELKQASADRTALLAKLAASPQPDTEHAAGQGPQSPLLHSDEKATDQQSPGDTHIHIHRSPSPDSLPPYQPPLLLPPVGAEGLRDQQVRVEPDPSRLKALVDQHDALLWSPLYHRGAGRLGIVVDENPVDGTVQVQLLDPDAAVSYDRTLWLPRAAVTPHAGDASGADVRWGDAARRWDPPPGDDDWTQGFSGGDVYGEIFRYFDADGDAHWNYHECRRACAAAGAPALTARAFRAHCWTVGADLRVGLLAADVRLLGAQLLDAAVARRSMEVARAADARRDGAAMGWWLDGPRWIHAGDDPTDGDPTSERRSRRIPRGATA